MPKIVLALLAAVFIIIPLLVLLAGQSGWLSGKRPTDLGVNNGLLKAPVKDKWNVVSSHASLQPHTNYHVIEPLHYNGDGKSAFAQLTELIRNFEHAQIIETKPAYLYAEFTSPLLKFVDDVEFLLDEPNQVIQMRSASRLGSHDFGANRKRLEMIRSAFDQRRNK